jgi:hypothetical protein
LTIITRREKVTVINHDERRRQMALATMKQTQILTGRIFSIPRYFGGDGAAGDNRWETAHDALRQMAKHDPVLRLIAKELDDAAADRVESALSCGRELGPDRRTTWTR